MMKVTLLVDIGSTNTKITAVDLENEEIVGRAYASSTVDTDMTIGLDEAYRKLLTQIGHGPLDIEAKFACSSAAGGLRLIAIGLIPSLTTEAAKRAALGAGAKVVNVYSRQLSHREVREIETAKPDIVLLAGGTDGGNAEVIVQNSKILSQSDLSCPIIVAGNKTVSEEVVSYLKASGKAVELTDNVLPELDQLNVEPCRSAIREIFINRIVHGKGLDKAQAFLGGVAMPTPLAVLNAAVLISRGTPEEKGLGELIVVDIGGATTDVISISAGRTDQAGVIEKGLPEPYAKRTVEGDLGIRYNACNILELAGIKQLRGDMGIWADILPDRIDLEKTVKYLSAHIRTIPQDREDFLIDAALSRSATRIAVERHAGSLEQVYTPSGMLYIQRGKNLGQVKRVIGTGGVIAYGMEPRWILEAARHDGDNPFSLKPKNPEFFFDKEYILYAVGLLNEIAPDKALRIAKRSLRMAE
jgi:uncharacterized protein (TIGR01319 family)